MHTYILIDRESQQAVYEFFNATLLPYVNRQRYAVRTTMAYLCALRRKVITEQAS